MQNRGKMRIEFIGCFLQHAAKPFWIYQTWPEYIAVLYKLFTKRMHHLSWRKENAGPKKNIAIGFEALSAENFRGRNPINFTPPKIPKPKKLSCKHHPGWTQWQWHHKTWRPKVFLYSAALVLRKACFLNDGISYPGIRSDGKIIKGEKKHTISYHQEFQVPKMEESCTLCLAILGVGFHLHKPYPNSWYR